MTILLFSGFTMVLFPKDLIEKIRILSASRFMLWIDNGLGAALSLKMTEI